MAISAVFYIVTMTVSPKQNTLSSPGGCFVFLRAFLFLRSWLIDKSINSFFLVVAAPDYGESAGLCEKKETGMRAKYFMRQGNMWKFCPFRMKKTTSGFV